MSNDVQSLSCVLYWGVILLATKMDNFQSIYYQSSHLWKRQKAIKNLKELSKGKPKVIEQSLSKQAIWQVHSLPPKHDDQDTDRPYYKVEIPNEVHQFDLLYMPSNTLYGNKYKYILSGIDVASRYIVARPMRTKQAADIAEMKLGYLGVITEASSRQRFPRSYRSTE